MNATAFERAILAMTDAGLAIRTRLDIGGIEIAISDRGEGDDVVIVLAPNQALEVAQRLYGAVVELAAAEGRL